MILINWDLLYKGSLYIIFIVLYKLNIPTIKRPYIFFQTARRTRNSGQLHWGWYQGLLYREKCWDERNEPALRRSEVLGSSGIDFCHSEVWSRTILPLWWNWSGKTLFSVIFVCNGLQTVDHKIQYLDLSVFCPYIAVFVQVRFLYPHTCIICQGYHDWFVTTICKWSGSSGRESDMLKVFFYVP